MKLSEKVAIVTGAGTGMGRAIAELFAGEGAKVAVNYAHSHDAAESVVAGIREKGGTAISIGADVSKQDDANKMIADVEREFGRLDYLINNAGWSTRVPHPQFDDLTDEIWDRTLDVNLRGVFYCVRAATPLLKRNEGASIVNIASVAALTGQGSSMVYAASKAGLVTLTKSLARALAPEIRVNAVLPGLVRTRFANWPSETFDHGEKVSPLGRIATVEDVADATYFFAVTAKSTTGETLVVDAGMSTIGPKPL